MRAIHADIEQLRDAAVGGTFTPIIGAACSTLDHKGEPRSQLVADVQLKARTIAKHLDEAEQSYLDELIDYDHVKGADVSVDETLLNFYVSVLRFDRCVSLMFKAAAAQDRNDDGKHCEFLWKRRSGSNFPRSLVDWHVTLATSPRLQQLFESLDAVIVAADEIQRSPKADTWCRQGLGAAGILETLKAVRKEWFDAGRVRPGASINLVDMVWLGNLFWHTLRFDRPYYPTTAELSFQLSLQVYSAQSPRYAPPLLAQAAQALGYPHVLSCLREWFQEYAVSSGKSEFYRVLARWLRKSFHRFCNFKRTWGATAWPLPLVFTTNYDQEIEKALEAESSPYHVVFPVYFAYGKKSGAVFELQGSPRRTLWLMKTCNNGEVTWNYAGQTNSTTMTNQDGPDPYKPSFDFAGPLVVKLHGSPLEALPAHGDRIDDLPTDLQEWSNVQKYGSEYKHRIILTESDYLADLRGRDLPRWLLDRMQTEKRDLFFLGQSISDWNIRLRLADHASWVSNETSTEAMLHIKEQEPRYHRFAVNRTSRYFDAAFMGPLRIAQVEAELELVQSILAETTTK